MAKARMLHNEISRSLKVNDMSSDSQILFTWAFSHADDEGRMRGEARYIRGTVVPLKDWSVEFVEECLNEIEKAGLIYRWADNGNQYIEFINWTEYQKISPSKFKKSLLPTYPHRNISEAKQTQGSMGADQYNVIESNPIEVNKSEFNTIVRKEFADISTEDSESGNIQRTINPKTYKPDSREEFAAHETWNRLEPNNPMAFQTTYLRAAKQGLPADLFFQFASEIEQDPTVRSKGKVFNTKVRDYFEAHSGV